MYDIVIVGGGPAGATLARLIGKKYKTLLLEKRRFDDSPESGHKCCGGLLAPDAQEMLARFGLGVPKSTLAGPQLFAVRTIDITNSLERYVTPSKAQPTLRKIVMKMGFMTLETH